MIDGIVVAQSRIERTVARVFSMSGETFDVGTDTGSPVGHYGHQFDCTAEIVAVTLERLSELNDADRDELVKGRMLSGLSAH